MKKDIAILILLFIGMTLFAGCSSTEDITSKNENKSEIELIIDHCNKLQSQINMRIIPSCVLERLKEDLNYSKKDLYKYCQSDGNSRFCDEDIEILYKN